MAFKEPENWLTVPADYRGDAIVAAMSAGGIDHLFFTSGTEIGFYQESIAKGRYHNRPVPRLITVNHEHTNLNAAIGFSAVSGKPVATAAHVDVGTLNYGGAIHTAWRSGLPILITAGITPTAYTGSMPGARDEGGHFWSQEVYDQNGIVRQYTKWEHRLNHQDNPGLMVSRALQAARSEPGGPVYLSIPREVVLQPMTEARFPTADQLGITRPIAMAPDLARDVAKQLIQAKNPAVIVSASGRNPDSVPALVTLCELLGLPVVDSAARLYQSFPFAHPLYQGGISLKDVDAVLVLDASVPWMPGANAPGPNAFIAVIDTDPVKLRFPTYEFTADLRVASDPLLAIRAITAAAEHLLSASDRSACADRAERWARVSHARRQKFEQAALARAKDSMISPAWLGYQIGQAMDDDCLVIDDSMPQNQLTEYLPLKRPGSYFRNPGSSGGWGAGAAFGAKLGAPDRDIILTTGDGFYMFGVPTPAIWAARHHRAPFLTIIYQNRSYTTGTVGVNATFPDGYAKKADFEGGYFDPPIDFAKEAEAAGAYAENVRDPAELGAAIKRGLAQTRNGTPAVISAWLPRLLHQD